MILSGQLSLELVAFRSAEIVASAPAAQHAPILVEDVQVPIPMRRCAGPRAAGRRSTLGDTLPSITLKTANNNDLQSSFPKFMS
jgi:hypothetical protein